MINAEKLNETINTFQEEVAKIKSVTQMYDDISRLEKDLHSSQSNLSEINKNIDNTVNHMKAILVEIEKDRNVSNHTNEEYRNLLIDNLNNFKLTIEKLDNLYESRYLEVRKETRNQIETLESFFNSKLDRLTSDVEVEIRNQNKSLEESLGKELNNMERDINITLNKNSQIINKLIYATIVVGVIVLMATGYNVFLN